MSDLAVLIHEIETLPPSCRGEVFDFVKYIKQKKRNENGKMEKAAQMIAPEYADDAELTAFCALDGEDFYEPR